MADKPIKRGAALTSNKKRERIVFPDRISIRFDEDVKLLMNASAQKVDWADMSHAVNAGLRVAMKKFAPPTIRIQVHPFDQLAFAKRRKITTKPIV